MANALKDKIAFVTGVSGAGQVGYAVAKAFVDEGAILALAARTKTNVDARAAELSQLGARVLPLAVDLTSETEVAGAIDRIIENYGRIDILVNLAGGLTRYKPVIDHTLDDWQQELANNLLSTFLCSRAVLPRMRASGGGTIINFTRAGAAQANMAAYNCAKAGIEALTRTLALEARDADIRVNAIAPGLVDTESNIAMMKPQDLTRWTKRDDIARSVVFLASDASAGVTGQVLAVTGWGI